MEKLFFFWLDNFSKYPQEHVEIKRFQTLLKNLILVEDENQLTKYIEGLFQSDKIVIIVNGQLVEIEVLQKIQERPQISSIYIYYCNQEKYTEWANKYEKIKGIFTGLNELIEKVLSDYSKQQNQNTDKSISFDIFNGDSTSALNGGFIHSQLLIDCLIRLQTNQDEKKEFITFYNEYDKKDKLAEKTLEKFLNKYSTHPALWWYSWNKGVYRILNESLRNKEIDLLYYLRFFLRDIKHELENRERKPIGTVYRCQYISCDELKRLKTAVGQLISVNTFFSTSRNARVASWFDGAGFSKDTLENVQFNVNVGSCSNNIQPFADISEVSSINVEEEILFMAGSVFRIDSICRDAEKSWLWVIEMTPSSTNDKQIKEQMDYMISKYESEDVNLYLFGSILRGMGKWHDAAKYYSRFLKKSYYDTGRCYYSLGIIAHKQCSYEWSLICYQEALKIIKESFSNMKHPDIGKIYNSMAMVYREKDDYQKALGSFSEALKIFNSGDSEDVNREDDLEVARCYYNMGNLYEVKKEYSKANDYHQRALTIRQKHLPQSHSDIGQSECSIGNDHYYGDRLDSALEHYYSSLEIYERSCPDKHIDIATVVENIAAVYECKHDWRSALAYLEKAKTFYINTSLLHEYSAVKTIEESIDRVLSKLYGLNKNKS